MNPPLVVPIQALSHRDWSDLNDHQGKRSAHYLLPRSMRSLCLSPPPPVSLMFSTSQQGASRKETRVEESFVKPKSLQLKPDTTTSASCGCFELPCKQMVAPSFLNANLKTPTTRLTTCHSICTCYNKSHRPPVDFWGWISLVERPFFRDAAELAGTSLKGQLPEIYGHERRPDNSVHHDSDLFKPWKRARQ